MICMDSLDLSCVKQFNEPKHKNFRNFHHLGDLGGILEATAYDILLHSSNGTPRTTLTINSISTHWCFKS